MSFDDLPLIPDDESPVAPDQDVDAAAASLLDASSPPVPAADVPEPFGRTPLFDFERGRFVRAGGRPVWVTGLEAVQQWVLMVIHTARFAHPQVFSENFGMDEPDSVLGEAADIDEAISDWGERLAEACVGVHERITAVEDLAARWVPEQNAVVIDSFTIVTDEGEITVEDLTLEVQESEEQTDG